MSVREAEKGGGNHRKKEKKEGEGIVESQKKGEKLENRRKFKKAIKLKY